MTPRLLLALLAFATVLAGSADARTRYTGSLVVTGKSGTCSYDPVGDRWLARFQPSDLGDNGTESSLSLFWADGALNFQVAGRFTNAFKPAEAFAIFDFGDELDVQPRVRFSKQTPAKLSTTTPFIDIVGQIRGFNYMEACTVTFRLSVTLRP
jgi:hypothetical protein